MIQTWGWVVAVCLTDGTAQVPQSWKSTFKATVLSCYFASRAQIHCSPSLDSNNWTLENRVSNLSAQQWLLGPWPSIFKPHETWQNQDVWYIKQSVFRVPKAMAERGRHVYWRPADAPISLNLTTWQSAQLRSLQPSHGLIRFIERSCPTTYCKRILNNNCSSYAAVDGFHWRTARNEPVPSLRGIQLVNLRASTTCFI